MVRLSALALLACSAAALNPMVRHFNILEFIEGAQTEATTAIPEEWFENQKLDHNDKANNQVWKQRFFTNDEFYGGAGYPVFLYINGENVATAGTVTATNLFMNVLAKKHKALIVSLEHRYYGKSQPVADYSVENLKYLTAEQALNDMITFQDHLTEKRKLVNAKWVAFGGSYPGMLAAWAKLKHGDRFVGSVASSGPILAKADYHEYGDVVAFGLKYFGKDQCADTVKTALKDFHNLVASSKTEDVAKLKELFNPCAPLKDDYNRATIEGNVFGSFQGLAQYNDNSAQNLTWGCQIFNANDGKSPLEKLAAYNKYTYPDCTDSDYQKSWIAPYQNINVTTTGINRQWIYQTCAEFGFGQTTKSAKSLFSVLEYADVDKVYYDLCKQAFGITKEQADANIVATNKKYGALNIDVPNVVFPNGNIDPWSALSLVNGSTLANPKSEIVYIDGTSHCRDMRAPKSTDNESLTWGRQRIENAVDRFLRDQC
ncbi:hypothetical protein LEN26_008219 [Aphanomyces euteiches]|nr:hypothetical protein AeMF1_004824 [Aphanomyces euteiches]KAH9130758.1 hypothetical protein LEN26_008219 [Aphanomyces euteiches]KAH9189434.1 hypothetical protein AeNC1_008594 [Aphanomyces euteiches]